MRLPSWLHKMPWIHTGAAVFFILLMLFDFKLAFQQPGQPWNAFGLSLINSRAEARWAVDDVTGAKFVATRTDVWNCFHLRDNIMFDFGFVAIPDRCQERYYVTVQTETCQTTRAIQYYECSQGTWRWNPNPPCGFDSPTGWCLPPC